MQNPRTPVSRSLTILLSILFTAALLFNLLLISLQHTLFNAETYKRGLLENRAYERLPELLAESASFERLLANTCAEDVLACLDQVSQPAALPATPGAQPRDDNPFASASTGVQICVREIVGDETYAALAAGQRLPSQRETRKLNACIRQERREVRLRTPGLGNELLPLLENLSGEQREEMLRLLFPSNDLQFMTEAALDQVFSYLDGATDNISISTAGLRSRLTGQAGDELILLLLAAQPVCTPGQLAQIDAGEFENGGDTALYCSASGPVLAKMLPPMRVRLDMVISQMPDEVVLLGPDTGSSNTALTALRSIRKWMRLGPLALVTLLVLVTAFAERSLKGWLRGWGAPLLIAGLIGLNIGLASSSILEWVWLNHFVDKIPSGLSPGLIEVGHPVFLSAAGELGRWLALESGLMILLGLAAILGPLVTVRQ